ncbi:ATP-binding protein [Protaetiibacter sp. SSC-01]|uniref:sensor histidine kinase n=1 Tax=Protaetiibacter sp. SSC-01 TaxID=2759943 RepID=UPI0016574EFD|nr:ATP-binding protein [Protaetiibacter sp. SSC-01]QNO38674.1 ATP-binding protein [Protaetiibacter sp. SSC-01]
MDAWLDANATSLVVILAVAAAVLLLIVLVLIVLWLRARRGARLAARERAAAERDRLDLELTLAEQGGRLRMVRELHEVAIRALTVIIAQAEGARSAAAQDPAVAARTAGTIADSARAVVADLRRVTDVALDAENEAGPAPELSSVQELVDATRAEGIEVELVENGEPHALREGAEVAVLRILQEALANAVAHGGRGTHVRVTLGWTDDGLQLLVEDDGARAAAIRDGLDPYEEAQKQGYTVEDDLAALTQTPAGRGITEMRERAELFGGVFDAHRVAGVGFTVQAVFPALRFHNAVDETSPGHR